MEYTVSSQNVHDQNINMSAHGFEYFKSAGKIMLIQIFLENMEYTYVWSTCLVHKTTMIKRIE